MLTSISSFSRYLYLLINKEQNNRYSCNRVIFFLSLQKKEFRYFILHFLWIFTSFNNIDGWYWWKESQSDMRAINMLPDIKRRKTTERLRNSWKSLRRDFIRNNWIIGPRLDLHINRIKVFLFQPISAKIVKLKMKKVQILSYHASEVQIKRRKMQSWGRERNSSLCQNWSPRMLLSRPDSQEDTVRESWTASCSGKPTVWSSSGEQERWIHDVLSAMCWTEFLLCMNRTQKIDFMFQFHFYQFSE